MNGQGTMKKILTILAVVFAVGSAFCVPAQAATSLSIGSTSLQTWNQRDLRVTVTYQCTLPKGALGAELVLSAVEPWTGSVVPASSYGTADATCDGTQRSTEIQAYSEGTDAYHKGNQVDISASLLAMVQCARGDFECAGCFSYGPGVYQCPAGVEVSDLEGPIGKTLITHVSASPTL